MMSMSGVVMRSANRIAECAVYFCGCCHIVEPMRSCERSAAVMLRTPSRGLSV